MKFFKKIQNPTFRANSEKIVSLKIFPPWSKILFPMDSDTNMMNSLLVVHLEQNLSFVCTSIVLVLWGRPTLVSMNDHSLSGKFKKKRTLQTLLKIHIESEPRKSCFKKKIMNIIFKNVYVFCEGSIKVDKHPKIKLGCMGRIDWMMNRGYIAYAMHTLIKHSW